MTQDSRSSITDLSFKEDVDDRIHSRSSGRNRDKTSRSLGRKYSWEGYEEFLEPFISEAVDELSEIEITLSKEIYTRDPVNIRGIEERLNYLSTKEKLTLNMALEMAYGAHKLYDYTENNKILKAGKKAHKAAVLFLQAEILREEGNKLLEDCQDQIAEVGYFEDNDRGRKKKSKNQRVTKRSHSKKKSR